jgi:lysophospholipase L1-like esterase
LGDSLTDGRGSTTNENNRWPDILANRIQASNIKNVAVVNAGIGGNCIISGGLGPTALSRLSNDVLTVPGVKWMILFEGINDLGSSHASSDSLIAAYKQIVDKAHAQNIKVFGATLTPCKGSFYGRDDVLKAIQDINTWMRTSNTFDAVLDFYNAVVDPNNPETVLDSANSGDHLHLSPYGYELLANCIDLSILK